MDEFWHLDPEEDYFSERNIQRRMRQGLSNQFSMAAWFLRIVPDVTFNYVNFLNRSQQLGIKITGEVEKYMHGEIGIEIVSPKHGTIHIYGPGGYEVQLEEKKSLWLINPRKNTDETHFNLVKMTLNEISRIVEDKFFGDIWQMEQMGFIQDKYIDLTDVRKLESMSVLFEAWARTYEELSVGNPEWTSYGTKAYLDADSKSKQLRGKLELPHKENNHNHCIEFSDEDPHIQLFDVFEQEIGVKFLRNMLIATQNPNRP
jgi:hypothetical protein